jgi:hypothetical protein
MSRQNAESTRLFPPAKGALETCSFLIMSDDCCARLTQCDNCSESAQIVIESFPSGNESKYLFEGCAATALYEHPRLLAMAVVSLIVKQEGWISAWARS